MSRVARPILAVALTALAALVPARPAAAQAEAFDLLIRGGRVMDGTGNPWFLADVGVRGDRIVAVGDLSGASARRTIDAAGKVVAPGFIDIHSHADDNTGARVQGTLRDPDARYRAAPNLVSQGITTVVVNHDGRSPWPIAEQRRTIAGLGHGPNVMLMVGHGEVRRQVMGSDFRRPATPDEIARMKDLVRQAMSEGAVGLSAGLEYVPGRWSTTDEVVALVGAIVPFNGVYISHERSEGPDPMWYWPSRDEPGPPTLIDAVSETIEIGERTGARVVASHIKAKGAHYWGTGYAVIQLIEAARARGVQIWADQYPYNTSGTDGNAVMIPGWVWEGMPRGRGQGEPQQRPDFAARLREVLADAHKTADLRRDITHEIRRRGGAGNVVVFDYPDSSYIGKSLGDLAEARGVSPVDMAIALQLEGYSDRPGGARSRGFSMSELDIEAYAARPWVATATDGGIALPEDGPGTHARFYGTFPRKIRHYAMERGVLSVENAVRAATSMPARIMGLDDRGMIRAGMAADIVVFDPARIRDTATFFEPHQYAQGVDWVFVNGTAVVEQGRLTQAMPGRVLTHEAARAATDDR